MIRPQIGSREQGNVMNVAMCDISGGSAQDFNKGLISHLKISKSDSSTIPTHKAKAE